jgi:hypothetical protein
MINALEVRTVIARHRLTRSAFGLIASAVVSGSFSTLAAQPRRVVPPPDAKRFMVPVIRSTDKAIGLQLANAIREKMTSDIPLKEVWTIPKSDIEGTLQASGYSITEALPRGDTKVLANLIRADEYIEGVATKTPTGTIRFEGNLVLSRDNKLTQPLPIAEGNVGQVASAVVKSVREARKQLPAEAKCRLASTDRPPKYAEAMAAAQAGVVAYPQATLARICIVNALAASGAGPDTIIAVANQILKIDPRNRVALELAADAYDKKNDDQKYVETLTLLLSADPTDVRLRQRVVEALARSGNPGAAKPIIVQAVAENPGDPDLLRLKWLILLTTRDWKEAISTGEEMVKTDTAAADTSFFDRLSRAYLADSQPQKAAESIARGVAKFPANSALMGLYPDVLMQAGQTQQAIMAYRKAMSAGVLGLYPRLIGAYRALNQPDSLWSALQEGRADTANATLIAGVALQQGNAAYKLCSANKTETDCMTALKWLSFSDTVKTSPESKFLTGATAFTWGIQKLQDASKSKSCEEAKVAQDMLLNAQINVPAGGAKYPDQAKAIMGYIAQYAPTADNMVKQYCKTK